MKDYFRKTKIKYRYWPLNILAKILFVALMMIAPSIQWALILVLTSISYGFQFTNEVEALLPRTDAEIKKARLTTCNMVWLRYFIVCAGGFAMAFLCPWYKAAGARFTSNPMIFATFFTLQMVMTYSCLLERAINAGQTKKKNDLFTYLFNTLPSIVYFVYGWNGMNVSKNSLLTLGNPVAHAIVLALAAVLLIIHCVRIYSNWTLTDYVSADRV